MNNKNLGHFALLMANLIPVYGAWTGELTFFQVLYLYWFESLMMIVFNGVKILFSNGDNSDGNIFLVTINGLKQPPKDGKVDSIWERIYIFIRYAITRTLMLLFYLIFIIVFIGFMVTDKSHFTQSVDTVMFMNTYFNTALLAFVFSNIITLATSFFMNGNYRIMSPYAFNSFIDTRTIIIHVMTVLVAVIHLHFFEGKSYASVGEVVYVTLFVLIKTTVDFKVYNLEIKQGNKPEEPHYI